HLGQRAAVMRWAVCFGLLLCGVLLLGCGDSGSPPATANAGGAPPVPGGPPAPGGDAPPANPGETPPAAETQPAAAPVEAPPQESPPPAANPGEGSAQPGDQNNGNPNPGDDPNNPDATPRRPPPPRTFKEQSFAAYRVGNDVAGMKLLNAH